MRRRRGRQGGRRGNRRGGTRGRRGRRRQGIPGTALLQVKGEGEMGDKARVGERGRGRPINLRVAQGVGGQGHKGRVELGAQEQHQGRVRHHTLMADAHTNVALQRLMAAHKGRVVALAKARIRARRREEGLLGRVRLGQLDRGAELAVRPRPTLQCTPLNGGGRTVAWTASRSTWDDPGQPRNNGKQQKHCDTENNCTNAPIGLGTNVWYFGHSSTPNQCIMFYL